MTLHHVPLALVALLTLTLASCAGSSRATLASAHVDRRSIPIEVIPATVDGSSAVVARAGRVYVIERLAGGHSLALTCLASDGARLWSTNLLANELLPGVEFLPRADQYVEVGGGRAMGRDALVEYQGSVEAPLVLLADDRDVMLASYRAAENDSLYAIVRSFDASSGVLRSAAVVARTSTERMESVDGARFLPSVAPDSSAVAIWWTLPADDDSIEGRAVVVRRDATIVHAVRHVSPGADRTVPTAHLSGTGLVYFVSVEDGEVLRVARCGAEGWNGGAEHRIVLDPEDGPVTIADYRALGTRAGELEVALVGADGHDAVGVQLVSFDGTMRATASVSYPLTSAMLARETGASDLEDVTLVRLMRSSAAPVRTLFVLENREFTPWTVFMDQPVGPTSSTGALLVLAFESKGAPVWQRGIEKETEDIETPFWLYSTPALHMSSDALDVLYRDGEIIALRRFALDDGRSLPPVDGMVVVGADRGGGELTRSFTWTGTTSVMVVNRLGGIVTLDAIAYPLPR